MRAALYKCVTSQTEVTPWEGRRRGYSVLVIELGLYRKKMKLILLLLFLVPTIDAASPKRPRRHVSNHKRFFKFHDPCAPLTLPQDTHWWCKAGRHAELGIRFLKYPLTTPPANPKQYPGQTKDWKQAISFPVLAKPTAVVIARSFLDPDQHPKVPWAFLWLGNAARNKLLVQESLRPGNMKPLVNFEAYNDLLKYYRNRNTLPLTNQLPPHLKNFVTQLASISDHLLQTPNYFKYPSQEEPEFRDIIKDEIWQTDEVFVQQRLAGLNTLSLRKLKTQDYIHGIRNANFDWNKAMKKAGGDSFNNMVGKGVVYVLDYPLIHNLPNVQDVDKPNNPDRTMLPSKSPFTIFVSVNGKLKPVAIQIDLRKDALVYTPENGGQWLMAKEEVQRADITYLEIIGHLLKTHVIMEPICVLMLRSFAGKHPLHQMLKWHCKSLFVTNNVGLPSLLNEGEFMHTLFAIGHAGAVELLNRGYDKLTWDATNFLKDLEDRDVLEKDKLPYYPYRDDGILLWQAIGNYVKEYVDLFYGSDSKVRGDGELQNFARQLSASGRGGIQPAIGRIKGFPSSITTKAVLIDTLKRIVFIPVYHSGVNYPIAYYGGFVPNLPTKLYRTSSDWTHQNFSINTLPRARIATEQASLSMSLGSLRYDKLLDYGERIPHDGAKIVVKKYHNFLHDEINTKIKQRNIERSKQGKLTYPYFMPQWITNSIQT